MPQDQHFVPQVYLQRFAFSDNGDIWGLKVRNNHSEAKPKPKGYNKSQICTLPDYYKINDLSNVKGRKINDQNHIENHGFPYENSELSRIFNALEQNTKFLLSDAKRLLIILFGIKRRNPKFTDLFIDNPNIDVEDFVDKEVEKIKHKRAANGSDLIKIDFDSIKNYQKEKLKDRNYRSDLHKATLLDTQTLEDESEEERVNRFLSYKFTLLRTDPRLAFITSDNPGYTLKNGNQVFNLGLDHTHSMYFPISSLSTLLITFQKDPGYSNLLIYKNIHRVKSNQDQVNMVNVGTACNNLEYIYGINPDSLSITYEMWKILNS